MATRNILKLGALEAKKTAFLLCDIQEAFRPHVKNFGEVVRVANKMVEAAKHFQIPVYVSEQYPKGLGHTTKDVNTENAALVYEKTQFSMLTPELEAKLTKDVPDLSSVVLFGIEAHVCIEQTVMDLLSKDLTVHVLADGVSSRSFLDRELALQRLQTIGCFVGTSENVLFKLLRDKNHPAFKAISKLNLNPTPEYFGEKPLESKISVHLIQQQFFSLKFEEPLLKFISKLEEISGQLRNLNEAPSEKMIITKILMSLPEKYRHFVSAWESVPEGQQNLKELTSRLLVEEERCNQLEFLATSSAFIARNKVKRCVSERKCFQCGKSGHIKSDVTLRKGVEGAMAHH